MKSLLVSALMFISLVGNSYGQDQLAKWRNASQRTRNIVNFINAKIDRIAMGGQVQCHRIEDAHTCQRNPSCHWDREFDVCGYRNQGQGHFRGFESDLVEDDMADFGLENDIAAGISLAVIGAKTKRISQDVDMAVANYPQAIAFQYRDRACRRIDRVIVSTGALSLLLLIPNENHTPHVLNAQDFQIIIDEMQMTKRDLCF